MIKTSNRKNLRELAQMFGIEAIYKRQQGKFTGTTVIAVKNGHNVTVSEILNAAGFLKNFIESNFDVKDKKYAETLLLLKTLNYFFLNLHTDIPKKEQLHYAVDVIHEVEDKQTNSPDRWRINAEIAASLNVMIDLFTPINGS